MRKLSCLHDKKWICSVGTAEQNGAMVHLNSLMNWSLFNMLMDRQSKQDSNVMPVDTTGKQLYLAAMTPGFVRIAEKMPYR